MSKTLTDEESAERVRKAVKAERLRCADLCQQQADLSSGDYLVPQASLQIKEAILEGRTELGDIAVA